MTRWLFALVTITSLCQVWPGKFGKGPQSSHHTIGIRADGTVIRNTSDITLCRKGSMTQLEKLHVSPCLNRCHHEGATHWQCFRTKPGAQSGRPGLRINTYLRVLYRPGTNFQGKLAAEPELVHQSTRSVIQRCAPLLCIAYTRFTIIVPLQTKPQ